MTNSRWCAPRLLLAWLRSSAASGALILGACANAQDRLPASIEGAEVAVDLVEVPPLPLVLALEAAELAVSTCSQQGFATTVLVADLDGYPMAMLSANGANPRTHQIAPTKIAIVRKYGVPSSFIAAKVREDPALAAEIVADPAIGVARGGALPLMVRGQRVGYIAVSGAPSGEQDEMCAQPASQIVDARE